VDEPGRRWRVINELLHSADPDRTRTDVENRELCHTFADFFSAKITSLKLTICEKLSRLSQPTTGQTVLTFSDDSFHTGCLLDSLAPVTPDEVLKVLNSCSPKSSPMDFIPTSLLLACKPVFCQLIATLCNLSFSEGCFPSSFKSASITPLIKKSNLDKSQPSNYRPISNLNNISKIIERLFLTRFQPHILSSPNFNQSQSAYRRYHSTESAILSTLDNVFHSADMGKSTLLVSLDLSAAFDNIDHTILLQRLSTSFGISGTVYSWLTSYLTNRCQSVRVGGYSSPSTICTCGVPQGSVLGPLLFNIYTSPVAGISSFHGIQQQQYADDTQLFIALSPSSISSDLTKLTNCLASLHSWFCHNGLALNPDKSDSIILGTQQRSRSYRDVTSIDVAGTVVPVTDCVKLLDVTLDSQLTMDKHVSAISRSCFYHIRAIRHIRPSLTDDMAKLVACSLVGSRLDYANSALFGVSQANIIRLQRIQNTLARVVVGPTTYMSAGSAGTLQQLHWLPIEWRIKYKIAVLAFKCQSSLAPAYLSVLLSSYSPLRNLRSSDSNLLTVPSFKLSFGSRGFRVAAPRTWNSLPAYIRACQSFTGFRRHLKTYYFNCAFNAL